MRKPIPLYCFALTKTQTKTNQRRHKKNSLSLKLWGITTPQATDPLQFVKNARLIQMLQSAILGLNLIVAVLHQVPSSAWLLIHSYKPTALITHNCLAALKRGFNHTFHSLCLFSAQASVITGGCLCTLYTIHIHNRCLSCRMHIRYSDTKCKRVLIHIHKICIRLSFLISGHSNHKHTWY